MSPDTHATPMYDSPSMTASDESATVPGGERATEPHADERISAQLILSILATGIMAFIGILTETLTNVLFPELMQEFQIGTSTVQWLTTGYLLMVALVTPLSSFFKRRIKSRTIFLVAIALCIAGSVLAACTLNFPMLMIARLLQGAGTGMALPLMFNIILEQSPKSKIGMLMGVGGMVVAIAPALGPTVGGLVGTFMPWRWIFVVMLPFLVLALVLGLANIQQGAPTVEARINPLHVVCLSIAFVSFVFALDEAGAAITALTTHATNATFLVTLTIALLAITVVALLLFGWMTRRSFSPLVRLGVLKSVPFRWHLLAYVLLQMVTIGFGYMLPNSLQLGYGESVLVAGAIVLPGALIGAFLAPVSGSLLDKYGPVKPMSVAMAVALLGVILMATVIGPNSGIIAIGLCYLVYMLGFSMCFANTMTCGMKQIDPQFQPDGNAMFNTFQQLSGAVGTTLMAVCLAIAQAGHGETGSAEFAGATKTGAHWGFVVLAIIVACACAANIRAFIAARQQHAVT